MALEHVPFPLLKPAESVLGVLSFALAHSRVYKNNVIWSPLMFIMICVSKVYASLLSCQSRHHAAMLCASCTNAGLLLSSMF